MRLSPLITSVSSISLLLPTISALLIPDDRIKIRSVGYIGTGCPQGSLNADLIANKTALSFYTDDTEANIVRVGNGAAPSAQRRACTVQMELTYPGGWSFRIKEYKLRGYVDLSAGVTGQVVVKNFFSGVPGISMSTTNIPPNNTGNFSLSGQISPGNEQSSSSSSSEGVWAPCGGDGVMNFQTSAALQQQIPGSSGQMKIEKTEATFEWSETFCGQEHRASSSLRPKPVSGGGKVKGNGTTGSHYHGQRNGTAKAGYRPAFAMPHAKGWNATVGHGKGRMNATGRG